MGSLIDLTGQNFGRLKVIKRFGSDKWKYATWLCKCICGKEIIVNCNSLRRGNTKSCGCLQREKASESNSLPSGLSNMRQTIINYKNGAKKRGLEYKLTEKQFSEITKKDCYYCGEKPKGITNGKRTNRAYIFNGLDRIDNTKGYTTDNVVPCCRNCNYAKHQLTLQEFKEWIRRVYNRMEGKL
jgi:5-methylcytosine-specific restriction endonuclease McrA